jgi:hypothetical protein
MKMGSNYKVSVGGINGCISTKTELGICDEDNRPMLITITATINTTIM